MDTNRTSIKPAALRRFSGNEAQARSLIAQRAGDLRLELGGERWCAALVPVLEAPVAASGDWQLAAQWAGAALRLTLPGSAAQTWIGARFPELDLPALPAPFLTAIFDGALRETVSAIAALGRGPLQLERIEREPAAAVRTVTHHFLLTLSGNERPIYAALGTDSLGLMLIAGLLAQYPTVTNGVDVETLPQRLRAEIGRVALPAGALDRLALRDTLLLDDAWLGQDGTLWLSVGDRGIRVRCDGTKLTVLSVFSEIGLAMSPSDTAPPAAASHAPIPVGDIPVQISFDLGERTLTLAELKALQPGQTLDLGRPLSSAVNVRANGALIGRGELVEVDGRLGVTLSELAE